MIRISSIKLPCDHDRKQLRDKICRTLRIKDDQLKEIRIVKRSVDAREKPVLYFVYTLDVKINDEKNILRHKNTASIIKTPDETYRFISSGTRNMSSRPIIVGTGPAGLFCGYMLAENGYAPLLIERGGDVDERAEKVQAFWESGDLDTETNVSFGEGGAGTFSDGKLNTLVKDKAFRNKAVLELMVRYGAPEEILYLQKPHIGTDILSLVVKNIRHAICDMGGEVRFHCCLTGLDIKDGRLEGITVNGSEYIECNTLVLATGHSARDTFEMLGRHIPMEPKSFAVGLRIEHPQEMIDISQYGQKHTDVLGAASYKLAAKTSFERGVYSFCMCPGGYVVNASSENNETAVNGMSYHSRAGKNANSAIIVTVNPQDFPDRTYMGGVRFQRELERAAYRQASGKIPVQLLADFRENRCSSGFGEIEPSSKGGYAFGNLRNVLPEVLSGAILEAMPEFGRKIKGFDREDAVFSGVESRTSSPLRMIRNDKGQSMVEGIYPCGEGAGYAGGITSAAMDGIKIAECIAGIWKAKG